MPCKNICASKKYAAPVQRFGHYIPGFGTIDYRIIYPDLCRCTTCDTYMIWPGKWCPCCSFYVSRRIRRRKQSLAVRKDITERYLLAIERGEKKDTRVLAFIKKTPVPVVAL